MDVWRDVQSYENFRTPFRETQFAVLALSTYYPLAARAKGWDAPPPQSLSAAPDRLLTELHGSDAAETAAIEIAQFFSGNEIVG